MSTSAPARAPSPRRSPGRRRVSWIVLTVAVAVVGTGVAGTLLLRADSGPRPAGGSPAALIPTPGGATPATASPGNAADLGTTTPRPSPAPGPATPATGAGRTGFRFEPLWPFGSVAEAAGWQREALPGGHQPWRLDPGLTALSFAGTYLGYPEIDRVTSRRQVGDEAWIGVGATPSEGRGSTAAVLHLARIGTGEQSGRPWEVVGSEDTTLTITTPGYGSVVGARVTVGGRITGVDEALSIQVRAGDALLGRLAGVSVGGQNQPWTSTLTIDAGTARLATVAVSTGGHVRQVERFAITAVHVRPGG